MRKHFLLLFLMALLPLAGWATDYTGVVVTLASPSATYNGGNQLPGVTVQYDNAGVLADVPGAAYTATWNDGTADVVEAVDAKTYTLTIAATDGNTLTPEATGGLVKTFTIAKKLATVTINANAFAAAAYHRVYGWKPADFTGAVITTAKAALTDGVDVFAGFASHTDETTAVNNIVINWGNNVNAKGYYAAGEHTFTLSINSMPNYIVSLSPSTGKWYVDKKDLIIAADATTTLTYGDVFDQTTASTHVTYTGFVDGEDENDLVGTPSFTSTYDAADPAKSGVGDYSWSPSGQTSDNYNITYNNGIITVVEKDITTEGVSIADFAAVTYNDDDQKPDAITGSFNGKDLVATTDYTLTYMKNVTVNTDGEITAGTVTTDPFKNAGLYAVVVTGAGNFTGEVKKVFTINPKSLGVRTADQTIVYDADDHYLAATTVTAGTTVIFDGLEGDDAYPGDVLTAGTITLSLKKDNAPVAKAIDAGVYKVEISLTGVESTNYTLQKFEVGKLTISKRVVKITAKNQSKDFGTTDPYKAGVVATADDVTVATTPATEGILTAQGHAITAYPMLKREGDEAKDTYRLYLEEDTDHKLVIKKGDDDVTANYDPQFIDGTFTIGEGNIGIWADSKTVTYGDVTVAEAKAMMSASIIGMTEAEIAQVQDAVNAKVVLNVPAGLADTDKLPANETGYSISFADFTAADVIPAEILANYSSEITKYSASAKFIVNKKPLEIQVLNQSLLVGDEVKAASAQTVKILTTGLSAEEQNQVIDNIELLFSNASPEVPVTADKLTAGAATAGWTSEGEPATEAADFGIWYDGIVINPTAYNALAANYSISNDDVVAGILYVNGAGASLALDRNNPTEIMEKLTSGDNKTYVHVTFANNRTLSAGKWNMMVLPFEVSVPQLSATLKANTPGAIGYAIVNVLNSATTSENIRFELTMGTIPANTPFLVKPASAVDLNTVSFDNVMIVAPADAEVVNSDYTFGGVEFVGLYTNKADLSNTERTVKADKWVTNWTGVNLKPFEAYLRGCAAGARVFVEDFENGTTAIKELNAETGKAYNVDGWYTVNGIKLESMPTEKGVYINNGKKVVIK